jgi:hypothetical protein
MGRETEWDVDRGSGSRRKAAAGSPRSGVPVGALLGMDEEPFLPVEGHLGEGEPGRL